MRFKALIPFITVLHAVFGTLLYGNCPHFESSEFPDEALKPFEGDRGRVDYFSNVRFERLFQHPSVQEKYVSNHVIELRYTNETGEACFLPFQFVRKPANASASSTRTQNITQINTRVIEIRNDEHLFAFSCVEDGYRNLQFIWIVRRQEAWRMSLSRVQETFGDLLDTTKTMREDLMRIHHQLPFCEDNFWSTLIYCLAGVIGFAVIVAGVIYWKNSETAMLEKEPAASSIEHGEGNQKDSAFERSSISIA